VKNTLKAKVKTKPKIDSYKYLVINLWCVQVTVTLEDNKTTVFKSGTLKVSKDSNLIIGQLNLPANSKHKELLKKLQKKPEKNITSEKINKIILDLNPSITSLVCKHNNLDSQVTSRHQEYKILNLPKILKITLVKPK
jgi:hypothetical protein